MSLKNHLLNYIEQSSNMFISSANNGSLSLPLNAYDKQGKTFYLKYLINSFELS